MLQNYAKDRNGKGLFLFRKCAQRCSQNSAKVTALLLVSADDPLHFVNFIGVVPKGQCQGERIKVMRHEPFNLILSASMFYFLVAIPAQRYGVLVC